MEIIHRANGPARGIVGPMLLPNGGNDRLDAFHVPFDPSTEPVLDVVVNAVSVIHNVEPDALEPLESAVDPDALEGLVGPPSTRYPSDREVTFVYEGLEITVNSDGHVWLEWLEEES